MPEQVISQDPAEPARREPHRAQPRVILVRTKASPNVGAAARAMLNFGLRDLWLVAPRCRIDERAYALASHAAEVLDGAKVVGTVQEATADLAYLVGTSARPRAADNYTVETPREAAAALARMPGNTGILFGPEDHGLSNDELTLCQAQVTIPTQDFSSLNLAQAVVVLSYEWSVAAHGPGGAGGAEPVPRGVTEGLYRQLESTLLHIGYTDETRVASVMRMYRGFLDRAALTEHEVAAFRGLLRQAKWAADQRPELVPGNRDDVASSD